MPTVAEAIRDKLAGALSPSLLEVVDDSGRHHGHAGARPGGESHFIVTIEAEAFRDLSRVQRQRLVYGILAAELAGPVHALSLKTGAPGES
jgi:BolA family transcriptional regulator, general stress-responsive regulator